jgi:chitodextrinase
VGKFLAKAASVIAVLALLIGAAPYTQRAAAAGETIKQQVGLPAYFVPDAPWDLTQTSLWDNVVSSASGNFGFAVANVLNGPDYQADPDGWDYAEALADTHATGVKVIGYVDSGYFGRTGQKTRTGGTATDAWRAQMQSDVDAWYSFYGSSIDGIFFDQMDNDCGTANANAIRYEQIRDYVEHAHPGALVVANPGAAVPQCYENAADTILTFEGTYACYQQDSGCPEPLRFNALSWDHKDPRKIMHLVYDTSSGNLADAIADSKSRGAGYVYVTDDSGANPWDSIASYFSTELSGMPAGGTSDTTAPSTPGTFDTVDEQFTSVDLDWEKSTDGGSGVVGYDIYDDNSGKLLKSVKATTDTMQTASVTGLTPDTEYDFVVKARDGSGNVSSASDVLTFSTDFDDDLDLYSAPGQPAASNTTYTSTDLTWSHATGGEYARDYYMVYRDGNPVQKVPGSLNTAQVVGLSAGTSYSLTVKAFDTSGNVSPLSTARTVTTTSLPGGGAIANTDGSLTGTDATFEADYLYPWSFRRVYIDVDNNAATGHTPFFDNTIGADYVIENGTLLESQSNGAWNMLAVGTATPSVSGYAYTWTVPLSQLDNAGTTMKALFQAEGFAARTYTSPITVQ